MIDGPLLWLLNRSTGLVLLGLLTLTVVMGVLATGGRAGPGVPRFARQGLHRNLALLSVAMLAVHAVTAVVDGFVDLHWWDAVVPFLGGYEPLWTGLGTLGLDLLAAVTVTSAVRVRLGLGPWRLVHLTAYVAWGLGLAHALGIGTDVAQRSAGAVGLTAASAGLVLAAGAVRAGQVLLVRRAPR